MEQVAGRKVIRLPEVEARVKKSRSTIYRDVRKGDFPAPIKLGPNSIGWFADMIDSYLANLTHVSYAGIDAAAGTEDEAA